MVALDQDDIDAEGLTVVDAAPVDPNEASGAFENRVADLIRNPTAGV